MTPDELRLVQASFTVALERIDELTERFYDGLFDLAPELRELFAQDLTTQRSKLAEQLVAIVGALGVLDDLVHLTAPLGARHAGYGVKAHHYELVREALLGALGDVLDDDWSRDAQEAWGRAYDLVAETMMLGAASGTTRSD